MCSTYEETVARELSGWVSAAHLVSVSVAGAAGLSTKYLCHSMKESDPPTELPTPTSLHWKFVSSCVFQGSPLTCFRSDIPTSTEG